MVGPERELVGSLLRRDIPFLQPDMMPYFQDVHDHAIRVAEEIDTLRDLLNGAMEGQLSLASNKLNETMRLMAAWSIILMAMAWIAGIYGMNFHVMPELAWRYGYPWALGLMVGVGMVLCLVLRRRIGSEQDRPRGGERSDAMRPGRTPGLFRDGGCRRNAWICSRGNRHLKSAKGRIPSPRSVPSAVLISTDREVSCGRSTGLAGRARCRGAGGARRGCIGGVRGRRGEPPHLQNLRVQNGLHCRGAIGGASSRILRVSY